ncbi:TetR family transcriptional regulator [Nonomuraea fuscirosea]|uniref:TetR family transcriptional regulator n=1 Tax=Nonomuraea fuscirosea TaxID=1291556 RepID=A0A2T0N4C7_9ACTN|nr:TetR/AcrR family transcriptional regulator [Nonomuraea fuscirosea]PRX66947.1 TetR family transcriptional regulator [Nonomuraea fuscirosea]
MVVRGYRSPVRARHAEDTRRSIIEAAAKLFAEQGYARTSVAAVAAAAGVAVNTVYTSVGNKPALIMAMSEDGAADDTAKETERRIAESADPREILRLLADGTGQVRRRRQDTLAILLDNRNADPDVAAAAEVAVRAVRDRLKVAAARLLAVGGLREGLTGEQVEQTLWFYFGFEAWRTVRAFGWNWKDSADWLAQQATHALLPADGSRP